MHTLSGLSTMDNLEIPKDIPTKLIQSAISSPDFQINEYGWTVPEALEVLQSLEWSKVAIRGLQEYKRDATGFIPAVFNWDSARAFGESEIAYARRSRQEAINFIKEHSTDEIEIIALQFSLQDSAA